MNVLSRHLPRAGSRFAPKMHNSFTPLGAGSIYVPSTAASRVPTVSAFQPLQALLPRVNVMNLSTTTTATQQKQQQIFSPGSPTTITNEESGQEMGIFYDTRNLPKLKPSIVQRRLAQCKTYVGRERSIRQSPWKLNRICQLAAGLTLEEALTQLKFCPLKNADLVAKVLRRTSNLADIRDGLQMSQLEVAECFATKSVMLRRIKPMGRGRHGIMHHKFSHIRVVLREIDFPLRIYQQKSLNQKKKWLMHQRRAEQDAQAAKVKRDELERLMKQQEAQQQERRAASQKKS